jgi:hypothetical protein
VHLNEIQRLLVHMLRSDGWDLYLSSTCSFGCMDMEFNNPDILLAVDLMAATTSPLNLSLPSEIGKICKCQRLCPLRFLRASPTAGY